ncbi:MAG: hypothetical protein M1292_10640, partial [Bacteroidetes bacterium]|nr:hypothetical protein [Bacteroidota bacterium]
NKAILFLLFITIFSSKVHAVDFTNGLTKAVPVKNGIPPVIDGKLDDWDLSYMEPAYGTEQTADKKNMEWAVMYDADALYLAAKISLPGRPYSNEATAIEGYWWGDCLQVRLSSDPTLPYPIQKDGSKTNDRVAHIGIWKNTNTGTCFVHLAYGTYLNLGSNVNPQGSKVAVLTSGTLEYTIEVKLPWSSLHVPGGKNPFKPGDKTAFIVETKWSDLGFPAGFRVNPGTFAFLNPQAWGQLEFCATSPGVRQRPTMEQVIAEVKAKNSQVATVGVPIKIAVPEDSMEISVNVIDEAGKVIRELAGGAKCTKGTYTTYWDGYDAWGKPVKPGKYKWGAYLHKGLEAEFEGSVGTSGNPTYPTPDGKGAWGGDHSNPVDCTSDESGFYFLWPVAEAGKAIVKTDFNGKVLWRKTPFVRGGFGPLYTLATDGKYLYVTLGRDKVGDTPGSVKHTTYLFRMDASGGSLIPWTNGAAEVPLFTSNIEPLPCSLTPLEVHLDNKVGKHEEGMVYNPDCMGMAVKNGKVYMSGYGQGKIFIFDSATAEKKGELDCPGVRGINFGPSGNLYAVSFVMGKKPQVLRFDHGAGKGKVVVPGKLEAPYDVAVDGDGRIMVSDAGQSHQVKEFNAEGKLLLTIGKAGGRAWQGKYDQAGLLNPSGVSIDKNGNLLVIESSIPKVISQFNVTDGKLLQRWYGPGVYWQSTWPMPDDPKQVFYMLTEGIGRAHVKGPNEVGVPDSYWNLNHTPYSFVGNLESFIPQPEVVKTSNGNLYLIKDTKTQAVMLLENDLLRPVSTWNWLEKEQLLEAWIDGNGDGLKQVNEIHRIDRTADGRQIPTLAELTSSFHMESNGDLYFITQGNSILKVPCKKFLSNGLIEWDIQNSTFAVSEVLPGVRTLATGWRQGILGVRLDSQKNLYTVFNTKTAGNGGPYDFPSEKMAKNRLEGLSHTSEFNVVKFAKYDPQGNLLWMAGRKATAGAKAGEMYHFWNLAGLVNDKYIAGGSEMGTIYLYTHDGFYVDALMNNPADSPPPGPYTFWDETSGGRVQYFPVQDELWAYSTGRTFRIKGFSGGKVEGEQRLYGTVAIDKTYEKEEVGAVDRAMRFSTVKSNPMINKSVWNEVPASTVTQGQKELAKVQLAYDAKNLYSRMEIMDASPMENVADQVQMAFRGGDVAGILLGPNRASESPGQGDIRIVAAMIKGAPKLIVMKYKTSGKKAPYEYYTPAGGRVVFEYVGEVPGGQLTMGKTATGYIVTFAVPLKFLEFDWKKGADIRGDIDIRLSGMGQQGPQTVSRNYLFTPASSATTMTSDVPTEAKLYPQFWGKVEVE